MCFYYTVFVLHCQLDFLAFSVPQLSQESRLGISASCFLTPSRDFYKSQEVWEDNFDSSPKSLLLAGLEHRFWRPFDCLKMHMPKAKCKGKKPAKMPENQDSLLYISTSFFIILSVRLYQFKPFSNSFTNSRIISTLSLSTYYLYLMRIFIL